MFMLDTCICIEFLRGTMPSVLAMLQANEPAAIRIPAIVEAELLLGAEKSVRVDENREKVALFLAPFARIPFDSACAKTYAAVRADLERRGCPIGPNDLMIAATALAHGATLVTSNVREFERVEGLVVENWAECAL